jgi:hypothetical protein
MYNPLTMKQVCSGRSVERARRRLTALAYHEAGHAVVAVRLGHRLGPVTIRPDRDGQFLGRANYRFTDTRWGGDPTVVLAGYYAEKRHAQSTNWLGGSHGDIGEADRALDRLCGPTTDDNRDAKAKLWRLWERGAREIVKDPDIWRAIEALAAVLLEKKTLSGRAAKAIIEPIIWPGRATA